MSMPTIFSMHSAAARLKSGCAQFLRPEGLKTRLILTAESVLWACVPILMLGFIIVLACHALSL